MTTIIFVGPFGWDCKFGMVAYGRTTPNGKTITYV